MSLLATRLGYARLAEPVRFRNPWEQHASLRLRDGDTTVLADYDQHGRIHGGDPEQTMDAIFGELLCWGVFGIHEADPRLIVLGATGVVASLLVLARVSWPRADPAPVTQLAEAP